MSDDPDFNPFADEEPTEHQKYVAAIADAIEGKESGPVMEAKDNWVSFSFASDGGYDKLAATVHGAPEFVARSFGITDFDGRVSTLMKKAIKIDAAFKKWAAEETPGKG